MGRIKFPAITIAALTFIIGCASTTMAPKTADQEAKKFQLKNNRAAVVYIYRSGYFAALFAPAVLLNGVSVGDLPIHTYARVALSKSINQISVVPSNGEDSTVRLTARPGSIYFVKVSADFGLISNTWSVKIASPDDGKSAVASCDLIQSHSFQPQREPAQDNSGDML